MRELYCQMMVSISSLIVFIRSMNLEVKYWSLVQPVFKDLNASSIIRCKANLTTKTTEPVVNDYHTDFPNCITAILYMNTNNGRTIFRDGTKIHSKSNRLVVFDSNLQHAGVTCTDVNRRVVINFNFNIFEGVPQ